MRKNGFTLAELLIALAIAGMILALAVPAMSNALRVSRLDAATDELFQDIRSARSRAITTGWQYRIVGFDDGSGTNPNAYRVFGRQSTATVWPADTVAPFTSATLSASDWTQLDVLFPGVTLRAAVPSRFELTFDARGGAPGAGASFNPLRVIEDSGQSQALTVSVVGSVAIQ